MPRSSLRLLLLALVPVLLARPAQGQGTGRTFGVLVAGAVSGSPLGEIAERNGTYAIPGREMEIRLLLGSARSEWSVGVLADRYTLDQSPTRDARSTFDYVSAGALVGYSVTRPVRGVPIVYGVDLGWNRLHASSSTVSFYTGEPEDTRTRADAVALGATYGVEIPLRSLSLLPRVRISTRYPDFGGGDGYSALHPEKDFGFKASFGIGVVARSPLSRK